MNENRMSTDTLMEIIQTRIKANDKNPTSGSFLYDIYIALSQLKKYEEEKEK